MNVLTTFEKSAEEMRAVLCATLVDMAKDDNRIVAMDADTLGSSGLKNFAKAYPDRFIDCGIQEANMVGLAAGMSATGKIPFIHSFGPFVSRRVYDQLFLSVAYAKLNVNVIGSDPGVTAAYNGGTHMPFEDMGILRVIPEAVLVEPCDPVQLASIVKQLPAMHGLHYIRMQRKKPVALYEAGQEFPIGKAVCLRPGKDVTLVASGIMVAEALKAAMALADEGIDARVIDCFTWKPIDRDCLAACAAETGAIVTAENHNVCGGLSAAVAEVVCTTKPVPMEFVGIHDTFGEVGTEPWLRDHFHLDAAEIAAAAKRAIARK